MHTHTHAHIHNHTPTHTQVNQNLRSFGSMSRNDVQCMMYNHPDGLPTTIRNGLNQKVDHLLKVEPCACS